VRCPFCGAGDTKVVDSRLAGEGSQVRRRRKCLACEERFTTYESPELSLPRVIKQDGRRAPFDEEKLAAGVMKALEKRPVSTERVAAAINRIKKKLLASGEQEVESRRIGEWVMEELRDLDQVAYVRFASVYRAFQDVDAFREEIERLESRPSPDVQRRQLDLLDELEGKESG